MFGLRKVQMSEECPRCGEDLEVHEHPRRRDADAVECRGCGYVATGLDRYLPISDQLAGFAPVECGGEG